jgi:hypothetical protein
MVYSIFFLLVFTLTFGAKDTYAQAGYRMSAMESETNRPGSDYNSFYLGGNDPPASCEDACARDPRCMAWTYVQPNTGQGPLPRCWLKKAVPRSKRDAKCVSGYKLR